MQTRRGHRPPWMRAISFAAAVAFLGTSPAPASGTPRLQAAEEQIPVAGTFSYATSFDDTQPLIRGAVHAVRRIPGGTALYYSVGVPEGMTWTPTASLPVVSLNEDYRIGDAAALGLVDTAGLRYYQPMVGPAGCLCPKVAQLGTESGTLYVGWAVMPPLPPELSSVSVAFGFGNQVEDVPVGNGPLTPAVPAPTTELGKGWPALPDAATVGAVPDPARYVRALVRHVADLERQVSTEERPGSVDENLSADVLFAVDSATLTPAAQAAIGKVAARVKERAQGSVQVVGHTDSTGTPDYNARLSLDRARAVQAALQASVGPQVSLAATGRGEQEPVADNATPEGRAQNRRVTVTYAVPETK